MDNGFDIDEREGKMRQIEGFENYFVTRDGRVWSENTSRRNPKCTWLKPYMDNQGRSRIQLYKDGKPHKKYIHRLVLETYVGPCPEGMIACHNDGNPADNRLENLRWDTYSSNEADKIKHGTLIYGENHKSAKLNNWQVRVIRRLLEFGNLTQKEIAALFNVANSTISYIKHKKSRKYA